MSQFSAIDLSKLPAPKIIENVDFETVLADMVARYSDAIPDLAEQIKLESDPVRKILEIAAYKKVWINARLNAATKANMLAYSEDEDLDNLAAIIPLTREPGESNEDFRARLQLAPEGFSTAGPSGGYEFHALGADPAVLDVFIDTHNPARNAAGDPTPGEVHVYVLADPTGNLPDAVAEKVLAAVNDELVRPLTDHVSVKSPDVRGYEISAALTISVGPDPQVVKAAAEDSAQAYANSQLKLGGYVTRSGIIAALTVSGILDVELDDLFEAIEASSREVPVCGSIVLTTIIKGAA